MADMPAMRLSPRSKYLSIMIAAVQRAIAYRGTTFLNLVSHLIEVAVLYYLWRTVFSGRADIAGFDWDQMRTYILVSYAVSSLLSFYSLMRMTQGIRTGEIATELIRPIDYLNMQLAQTFGAALIEGVLSGALTIVLGVLVLDISAPVSIPAALLFFLSVWLGFLIKFLTSYLVALLCFRTMNAVGLIWAHTAIIQLFSGALIPLQFFPGWLRTLSLALPFQAIVYTPLAIYLGKLQGNAMWLAMGVQVLWVIVLWIVARLLWSVSLRALDIQGG